LADDNAAMNRRRSRLRKLLLLALVLAPPALAWSDAGFPTQSAESKKTCYCDCDMKAGTPMCKQMCELPKYANRSWAVSCLRKALSDLAPATPGQSGTHSRKTNRVQSAQLED
jgi:hypothetical protein